MTALRPCGRGRVAVELDGRPWRVLLRTAVAAAGVTEGGELDRARARALRRELRRGDALAAAGRTLRHRDASRAELAGRLARAHVPPAAREEVLATLERAGLVDDHRVAVATAHSLAERGWGDDAIAYRLRSRGFDRDSAQRALGELEPEGARARRIVERRGAGRRTAAYLARRGFGEQVVEEAATGRLAERDPAGYDTGVSSGFSPAYHAFSEPDTTADDMITSSSDEGPDSGDRLTP